MKRLAELRFHERSVYSFWLQTFTEEKRLLDKLWADCSDVQCLLVITRVANWPVTPPWSATFDLPMAM